MLAETGRAAVIHPIGTGKSFIGFKLCEDNPDKTVCRLSPGDYIFRTRLENLKSTGAEVPRNIKLFTYAKLVYISDGELAEIKSDAFLCGEFHRCGWLYVRFADKESDNPTQKSECTEDRADF